MLALDQPRGNATIFVTIVTTFPPFPLVNVGNEKIRQHEETSILRGQRGVSTKLDEGYRLTWRIWGRLSETSRLETYQSRTQSPQAPWSVVWSPGETLGKWNFFNFFAWLFG